MSNAPEDKKQIHFVLQGKGGVGKSLIASLLHQHLTHIGQKVEAVDTDPVNATFASYKAYNAKHLDILKEDNIDPRAFDELIEGIANAENDSRFVIDNGAATFVPLCAYLFEIDCIKFLKDNNCEVYIHTVITGGQALNDTRKGLKKILELFPDTNLIVWINEYFGIPERGGKTFEQSDLFKNNHKQIHGIVRIGQVKKETFGEDIDQMLEVKKTFNEAIESPDFSIVAKQRLKMFWKNIQTQLDQLQL